MQKIKDLIKSVFALKAVVACVAALAVSIAVIALALNLVVYEVVIDDNGNAASYKVYSKSVENVLNETGIELKEGDILSCNLSDTAKDLGKISITRAKTVTIAFNGENETVRTVSKTVGDLLKEKNIVIDDEFLLVTDKGTPISEDLKVEIIAKNYEEVIETESIPYEIKSVANNTMRKGTENVVTAGVDGTVEKKYRVLSHNGQVIEKELVEENITKKPVSKVVEYGTVIASVTTRGNTSGRTKDFSYSKVLEMTAYSYCDQGITASGLPSAVGRVAVDPRVIPLGTRLYIEAWDGSSWTYGYAVAADTGGAIKGHKIDLFRNTKAECMNFGVRKAKVYILD